MIRRKPEKAVEVLLARLDKAKEWALEKYNTSNTSLDSKFKAIEEELKGMTNSYPRIKHLEKRVTDQFCTLEQELYHDTFKEHESEEDVLEKLDLIKKNLVELKEVISTVDSRVTDKLRTMSFKPDNPAARIEDEDDEIMSDNWKSLGIEDKIFESEAMSSLLASFHCLESTQLKMCLMFLSVFPENSVIKKKPVIYWWIGEGVVTKKKNETAEEVGENVFQQLLIQDFIKPSNDDNNSITVKSFIVHPWIRRVLILAAQKNNFLTFSSQHAPRTGLRRAFLCGGDQNLIGEKDAEDLLTVFNVKEKYLRTKSMSLPNMKKVGVLQLGRWKSRTKYHIEAENQEELLKGLGSQKHLKYLSLRGISRIETLPNSIADLFSLEILDLRACHNLEKLPPAVSALKNLTHLDVSECYLLESIPKGLEHLHALQVLKGFVVGKEWKSSCRISDLSKLEKLRKLSIRVGSNDEGAQGQLSHLNFPALQILTISWGVISSNSSRFSFPRSLRKLDLRCAPEWMLPENLPNLEKLYITGGYINKDLVHALEGLKTIKFLRLKYLKKLEIDEDNFLSSFQENPLRLEIINCGTQPRRNNPTVSRDGRSVRFED